ncbi:cathelicidin antimicrobial peptide [Arvicola amphibius]|uniref:cathelicidin antimicrobial peptide n=1 Tax=Arvicola amphibius TaxID=1047088 RepID=UPI0018E37DAE|nr:cathelicidin antimicrobial peptide [Arvicola amphibius]
MQAQRDNPSLRCSLSLLLLGLVLPLVFSQTLSYREAVLRAVDDFNQQSLDTKLYRLLDMDFQPSGDEDPDTPNYVGFRVKETVCDKATYQTPPEQCNFREHGLVKQCVATVNQGTDSFTDISCKGPGTQPQRVKKVAHIGELLRRGGLKIGQKIEKLGQKILNFFQKTTPEGEK